MVMGGGGTGQLMVVVVLEKEGKLPGRGGERTSPLCCVVSPFASDCLTVARGRTDSDMQCTAC
jgi:hypothetical protein